MLSKYLINFSLIPIIVLFQISFLNQNLFFNLRPVIVLLVFSQIFNNQKIFFAQSLMIGLLFDFFFFPIFFGFYSSLFCLMALLFSFLFSSTFTNRSLYSFFALNFCGNLFYSSIMILILDWQKLFKIDFWQSEFISMLINSFLVLVVFLVINSLSKNLKPIFLK